MNRKIILYLVAILLLISIGGYFFPTSIQATRINTDTKHSVVESDLATAEELFQKNNIDIGTLAIVEVVKDKHGITHIWSKQFYNGLPVFFGDIGYHFDKAGKAQDRSIIDGTKDIFTSGDRVSDLGISTEPSISASTAARKAREKMKSNYLKYNLH